MPGSTTTPDRAGARDDAPPTHVAFRSDDSVGIRNQDLSQLNGWPMRTPTDASGLRPHGSGNDAVRYSFIVMDFHHLLPAGLPAHPPASTVAAPPGLLSILAASMNTEAFR